MLTDQIDADGSAGESTFAGVLGIVVSARMLEKGFSIFERVKGTPERLRYLRRPEDFKQERVETSLKEGAHELDGESFKNLRELGEKLELESCEVEDIGTMVSEHYVRSSSPLVEFFKTGSPTWNDRYLINAIKAQKDNGRIYHREFAVCADGSGDLYDTQYGVVYDILRILGYRRTELFSESFSFRIYTVALPPGELIPIDPGGNSVTDGGYLAVPVLFFFRRPGHTTFRRTFSVMLVLVPAAVGCKGERRSLRESRRMTAREINIVTARPYYGYVKTDIPRFNLEGDLKRHLKTNRDVSISELLEKIVMSAIVNSNRKYWRNDSRVPELQTLAYNAVRSSWQSTSSLSVPWQIPHGHSALTLNSFLQGGSQNQQVQDLLTLVISPNKGVGSDVSPNPSVIESLCTYNEYRTTDPLIAFYNNWTAHHTLLIDETCTNSDSGGSHNLVPFSWSAFEIVGISSLKRTLLSFYHEVEEKGDVRSVLLSCKEFTEDLDELFDLDLTLVLYREQYEKVREMTHLDNDYQNLKAKVDALSVEMSTLHEIETSRGLTFLTFASLVLASFLLAVSAPTILPSLRTYPIWIVAVVTAMLLGVVWWLVAAFSRHKS